MSNSHDQPLLGLHSVDRRLDFLLPSRWLSRFAIGSWAIISTFCGGGCIGLQAAEIRPAADPGSDATSEAALFQPSTTFLNQHCLDCHSGGAAEADFSLDQPLTRKDAELVWRRVLSRQMPPPDMEPPPADHRAGFLVDLQTQLDTQPPSDSPLAVELATTPLRLLTRTQYIHTIADIFDIHSDLSGLLPEDAASHDFDTTVAANLSPANLQKYLAAAEAVAAMAVGHPQSPSTGAVVRIPPDRTQERHVQSLPFGTRGGTRTTFHALTSGGYRFAMKLAMDRDEKIEGLDQPATLLLIIDGVERHRFELRPPKNRDYEAVQKSLVVELPLAAGEREIIATFVDEGPDLLEIKRQPFDAAYNRHRHPRTRPALYEIGVFGPVGEDRLEQLPSGSLAATVWPTNEDPRSTAESERERLATWLSDFLSRLYRRPATDRDIQVALRTYDLAGEELGMTTADHATEIPLLRAAAFQRMLTATLINPNFLLRVETTVDDRSRQLTANSLAERLAFFLWNSAPDETLARAATDAAAAESHEWLSRETRRLLADRRSSRFIDNFSDQWLYLKNLGSLAPDLRLYPDFDDNLRRAMRTETQLLLRAYLLSDEPIAGLLDCDASYVDERLARHYGLPAVAGSGYRRVDLSSVGRSGLLRQGSLLAVTSYATRTSPTVRGNWILSHILGTPPPPPPPDVPALKEKSSAAGALTLRERLAQHRADTACAACHDLIDPMGFALENYDALGRYRRFDGDAPIDASAVLPSGEAIDDYEDLQQQLSSDRQLFVLTIIEKLTCYAVGRPLDHRDMPQIRGIYERSGGQSATLEGIIMAITGSEIFSQR